MRARQNGRRCGNCAFFDGRRNQDRQAGLCKKKSPAVSTRWGTIWPSVAPFDVCGAFEDWSAPTAQKKSPKALARFGAVTTGNQNAR
jgi:hypothetical protein